MKSLTILSIVLFISGISTQANVTHWRIIKGAYYFQSADNTPEATTTNWGMFGIVETADPGDATSVVITGGNIPGSIAYELEGSEWELGADYASKAALDAVFPSDASYSIILSGGTLGTVTQQFSIATDAYPNTPYLTGADYSDCLALEALEPFELNWNDAGNTTAVSLQVNTGAELDEGDTLFEIFSNNFTSVELPWNLFVANSNYNGYIDFANATLSSGTGGFEIDGDVSFNTSLAFHIDTVNTAIGDDNFNDNSMDANKWSLAFPPAEAVDTFSEINGQLEYTSAGTGDTFIAWAWEGDALSYTQDWSIAVDFSDHIAPGAFSGDEEIFSGLMVMVDGDMDNNISEEFINGVNGREAAAFVTSGGVEDVVEEFTSVTDETISVKIAFDADTKMLYSMYSTGGDYFLIASYSAAGWGMTDSSVFNPLLYSGNFETTITTGQVYADNVRMYDRNGLKTLSHVSEVEIYAGFILSEGNYEVEFNLQSDGSLASVEVVAPFGSFSCVQDWQRWEYDSLSPSAGPLPSVDGDWVVTVTHTNGHAASTVIPFAQANGSTPLLEVTTCANLTTPDFSSQDYVYATNAFFFTWDVDFDSNANLAGVGTWNAVTDQDVDYEFVPGAYPGKMYGPIVLEAGIEEFWIYNYAGYDGTNTDDIVFKVAKFAARDYDGYVVDQTIDADGDRLPNDWETEFFGGPTNAVAGDDTDGDTQNNFDEYIAGFDPTNSNSVFEITESEATPAGFVLNWVAVPGRIYSVSWTDSLTNNFEILEGYLPSPQDSYTDQYHHTEDRGFYSIQVELQD